MMIHSICLPSYDMVFPLSAQSVPGCTIMGFLSQLFECAVLANNYLRNPINVCPSCLDTHPMNYSDKNHIGLHILDYKSTSHQHTHPYSVTCSKHTPITNEKPAAPFNQILVLIKPFPKIQLYIQASDDVNVCEE